MRFILLSACLIALLSAPALGEDPAKDGKAKRAKADKPYGPPNPSWLTPRVRFAPVELPVLKYLTPDAEPLAEGEPGWVAVTLTRHGSLLVADGQYDLGTIDPGVQDDNVLAFTRHLRQLVPAKKHRNQDGTSKLRALIYADHGAPWKYVQWIMQAFAHPDVRVPRISFALRRAETAGKDLVAKKGEPSRFARRDSVLPTDQGPAAKPPPTVKIKMFRRNLGMKSEVYTYIRLGPKLGFSLPKAWQGRLREAPKRVEAYDKTLKAMRGVVAKQIEAHGVQPARVRV